MKNLYMITFIGCICMSLLSSCEPSASHADSPNSKSQSSDSKSHLEASSNSVNGETKSMNNTSSVGEGPSSELTRLVQGSRTGASSVKVVAAMQKLLIEWPPLGKSVGEVKTVFGTPSEEKADRIIYRFGDGDIVYEWTFKTSAGVVSSVEKQVLE